MRGWVIVDPDFILLYDEICRLYKRGLLVPKLCLGILKIEARLREMKQSFRGKGFPSWSLGTRETFNIIVLIDFGGSK